jgi:hypothetical protein
VIVFDENARPVLANPVAERILRADLASQVLLARLAATLLAQDGRWGELLRRRLGACH